MTKNNHPFDTEWHLSLTELQEYSRGKHSRADEHRIELHLMECRLCSDALNGLSELKDPMRLVNITRELHSRAKHKNQYRKKIFSSIQLVSILLILLLLILIGFIGAYFLYAK